MTRSCLVLHPVPRPRVDARPTIDKAGATTYPGQRCAAPPPARPTTGCRPGAGDGHRRPGRLQLGDEEGSVSDTTPAASQTADAVDAPRPVRRQADRRRHPGGPHPEGGWGDTMPPPILAGCAEPPPTAPPIWPACGRSSEVEAGGAPCSRPPCPRPGPAHRAVRRPPRGHRQRDHPRHAGGRHRGARRPRRRRDGLRHPDHRRGHLRGRRASCPVGLPVEVRRRREGDQLVWDYLNFTARLDRIGDADADPVRPSGDLESRTPEAN